MPYDDHQLETAAVIALVRRGGRAWHQFAELVEARGSAVALLREPDPDDAATPTLLPPAAEREPGAIDLDAIVDEVQQWKAEGISMATLLDGAYVVRSADEVVARVERLVVPDVLTAS